MNRFMEKLGSRGATIVLSLALLAIMFIHPFTREVGELWFYDMRLGFLRNPTPNRDIVFVAIDQNSLDEYGAFPWDRARFAEFIDLMEEAPPRILIFDVLFQESTPSDELLAESIMGASFPIVLADNFSVETALGDSRLVPVVEPVSSAAGNSGYIDLVRVDSDGRVRWAELARVVNDREYFSLDLVFYALLEGIDPGNIRLEENRIIMGDISIPTDPRWGILINYYFGQETGGTRMTFPVMSFRKFMERPEARRELSDAIVIVGAGSRGMQDDFPTPVDPKTYGAIIHANILDTVIRRNFIRRVPWWVNLAMVLLVVLLFGFWASRFSKAHRVILFAAIFVVVYTLINSILFARGIWIDLAPPVFASFGCTLVVLGVQFFRTHRLFQQFVAPEVVDRMVADEEFARLGGKEMEVSILFSDIRGYTTLSEKMSPSQMMEMLNEYHTRMVKIYERNHGRVFDYMGDAQMVVYGAPINLENHALWACRAALETQEALKELCDKWKIENRLAFEVGTGICTGRVAIGLVGAEGHKQYTAIGDSTNVASRLQGQSKVLGATVIISPRTAEMVRDHFQLRSLGEVDLKGKSEAMEVFTIVKQKGSEGEGSKL